MSPHVIMQSVESLAIKLKNQMAFFECVTEQVRSALRNHRVETLNMKLHLETVILGLGSRGSRLYCSLYIMKSSSFESKMR